MKKLTFLISVFGFALQAEDLRNYPPDLHENGFIMLDVVQPLRYNRRDSRPKTVQPLMTVVDKDKYKTLQLKPFRLNFEFSAEKPLDIQEPWLAGNWDVRVRADAEKIALALQSYVYEGWFEERNLNTFDSHFRENAQRTWCHTPWLNVTEKGREAIHGLTKEFPIRTGSAFKIPTEIEQKENAVTWGVAFFNGQVCRTYKEFFRESEMIKQIKDRRPMLNSPDGAVSFKLLFNAMPDWERNMPQWKGAYNWHAHVSNGRKNRSDRDGDESIRRIMNVPLVQIDVGLRDSRLKGTDPDLKNWIMVSYYYDPNYVNEALRDAALPEALKHMRPIGLQYGIDAGESFIFHGSENNHRPGFAQGDLTELPYDNTRLNGPVDNNMSSCLGCHAQAGLGFGIPPGERISGNGIGFLTKADYLKALKQAGGGSFDFNMQADKAMRNFGASKKQKINGPDPAK